MRKPSCFVTAFVPSLFMSLCVSLLSNATLAAEISPEIGPPVGPRVLYENYDGIWNPALPVEQELIFFGTNLRDSSSSDDDSGHSNCCASPAPVDCWTMFPRIVQDDWDVVLAWWTDGDIPDHVPVPQEIRCWDLPSTQRHDGKWIGTSDLPRTLGLWKRSEGWLGSSQPVSARFSEISRDEPENAFEIRNAE